MKLKKEKPNAMFLHHSIGEGKLGDRKLDFIQTNEGVHMQLYGPEGKGWDTYTLTWGDLSKMIVDEIEKLEAKK